MGSIDFTIPSALVCAVLLAWWIARQVRSFNQVPSPARQQVPDDGMDLHAADEFFHPTGRPAALVALAREGYVPNEMAPAAAERPGATAPSKEITHARSTL